MRPSRCLNPLVLLLLLAAPACAQLEEWHAQPVSNPGTIKLEQNLCVVPDGAAVHAFSAVTRRWTTMIAAWTQQPVLNIRNEHCMVQDGPVFWGFAPRRGTFTPLYTFSGTATLAPISSPQTWHDIVLDGNCIHVFVSIAGNWLSYTFGGTPTITNGRFAFAVEEGGEVYGVSSFHGALVPLGVSGATVIGAYGNMLFAASPGKIHGFSTSRNRWESLTVYGTPTITTGNSQPACALIEDGVQVAFYSGNTGTFTVTQAAPSATVEIGRGVALVTDGSLVYGYSGLTGTTAMTQVGQTPITRVEQYQAFLDDGGQTRCFSTARPHFLAAYPVGLSAVLSSAQVAVALDAQGRPEAVYSSYLGQWHPVPAGLENSTPHLTATSVILEFPGGGLAANSMRSTQWAAQVTPPLGFAQAGASPPQLAETFVAQGGNTLYAFNPLTEAWRSVATNAPASLRRAHHHVILCGDGTQAYAFSNWTDRWATAPVALPLNSSNSNTQVQAAYARDAANVYAYSGVGQLGLMPEFPHYYRSATLGSPFRLDLAAEPGAACLLAIAPAGAELPLGSAGTLRLDLGTMNLLAQAAVPASGSFALLMQIPDDPSLRGLELHFQAACINPQGVLYLTNAVVATML